MQENLLERELELVLEWAAGKGLGLERGFLTVLVSGWESGSVLEWELEWA